MATFKFSGTPFSVVARKSMFRGGRHWPAGVHEFATKEQFAGLGDEAAIQKMIDALCAYPADFEVKALALEPAPKKT